MENVSLIFPLILILFSSLFEYTDGSVSCTFDFGLCGWRRISSGQFKWNRGSGQSADRLSGPLNDHTCANYNGQYIYIPGIESRPNDTAILETEHVTITNGTVLTFWYMMHGFGTGELKLNTIIGNKTDTLWEKRGPQGKDWIKESVELTPGQSVKIQFKSSVRLPVASDIAIDDIILSSESQVLDNAHCSKITTEAMTTTSATTMIKPSTTHQASKSTTAGIEPITGDMCGTKGTTGKILPGTCDFETDTCGIKIVSDNRDARVTWRRTNRIDGMKKDTHTSILHDHTLGTTGNSSGYYMSFINGNGHFWQNPKYISRLETPTIYASYLCLSFWYSMPHRYSNLKLFVKDSHGNLTEIFNSEDNTAVSNMTGWYLMSMSVTTEPPFTIIFQTFNQYFMARVGIDDIQLLGFDMMTKGTSTTSIETTTTTAATATTTTTKTSNTTTTEFSSLTKTTRPSGSSVDSTNTTAILGTTTPDSASIVSETTSTIPTTQYSTREYTPTSDIFISSSAKTQSSILSQSTDKVTGKKTTAGPTKKPVKVDIGEKDSLKSANEFERTSLAVGASVGSLAGIAFLSIILYFIISHYRSSSSRHRQNNIGEHIDGKADSGFSNDKKPHFHGIGNDKLNGHIPKSFDNHGYCMQENTSIYDKVEIMCENTRMYEKLLSTKSDKITHL